MSESNDKKIVEHPTPISSKSGLSDEEQAFNQWMDDEVERLMADVDSSAGSDPTDPRTEGPESDPVDTSAAQ